jgi:hypothetical protein
MTEETSEDRPIPNLDKLTETFLKIRDARTELSKKFKAEDALLVEQMDLVEKQLLEACNENDAKSINTAAGLVMRGVSTQYMTSDWDSMYKFIKDNDALGLLKQSLHQSNMKQFLDEYPDKFPPGMLVDSKYKITVRRSK